MRENRGAKGAERGGNWGGGVPLPNRLGSLRERRELPQRGPGRSPGRQRIFGIFEVHRTLLIERTVPTKSVFSRKKSTQSTIGGHGPPGSPLNTPLPEILRSESEMTYYVSSGR